MKHPTGMIETEVLTYKINKNYILTHRRIKHFFKKYQSYGISKKELVAFPKNITHVLIFYTSDGERKPNKFYLTKIEQWHNGLTWNNILENGVPDPQTHVRVREMDFYSNLDDVPKPNRDVIE